MALPNGNHGTKKESRKRQKTTPAPAPAPVPAPSSSAEVDYPGKYYIEKFIFAE